MIDFAGSSTLNLGDLTLAAGATMQIKNWVAGVDYFIKRHFYGSDINQTSAPVIWLR